MRQGIVYCVNNPIRTEGSVWLNKYIGRIAVGREIARNIFDIIAYSDNASDSKALRGYARKNDAVYLKSVDNSGVTSIV